MQANDAKRRNLGSISRDHMVLEMNFGEDISGVCISFFPVGVVPKKENSPGSLAADLDLASGRVYRALCWGQGVPYNAAMPVFVQRFNSQSDCKSSKWEMW